MFQTLPFLDTAKIDEEKMAAPMPSAILEEYFPSIDTEVSSYIRGKFGCECLIITHLNVIKRFSVIESVKETI